MSLTRLGLYKLLGENPERCWAFMRYCVTWVSYMLSPGAGYGADRIPSTGGAVVAANHFSGIDPSLVGTYSRRTIYYMTKIELLSIPIAGELLRWTGAFAVRRGEADRDSLRMARWAAANGHVVGFFMEGTRQKFGYPGPAHPGAVMIAVQEGVPLVPCGVATFGWSFRNRLRGAVVFGEPISVDHLPRNGRGYKEGAALLEAEIVRLWRQAAEAAHAGFPATLPDGTPKSKPVLKPSGLEDPSLPTWPTEPWAKGPLGPVYREAR